MKPKGDFEKINKIDKPLASLTKNKGRTKIIIRNAKGKNNIDLMEIKRIIKML